MNTKEHLLLKLNEEALEVAHMAAKCLLFGLDEIYTHESNPAGLTNRQRLAVEVCDFVTLVSMCDAVGVRLSYATSEENMRAKIEKVNKFMTYSRQLGTLKD